MRVATTLALCALVAACGRDGNPAASFETRCATLPRPRFDVVVAPVSFVQDESRPSAELTAMSGSALTAQRTTGVTTAVFGQSTDIELSPVDDHDGARGCGTPRVRVELSMQPMTVFIASELAETPCLREATLSHEIRHVEVFRAVLEDAARALERELPGAVGAEPGRAKRPEELEQRLILALRSYLPQFMADWQRVLDQRQAGVDSPEEYARVSAAFAG